MLRTDVIDYESVGERVFSRRRKLGLTQVELAKRVNVSTSFIGHIERAEKVPSLDTMARLSRVLDMSMDEILFGAKPMCDREGCPLYSDIAAMLQAYGLTDK